MEFNVLIGKQALGIAQTQDFSDWAESLLIQGCDSENVAILASFGVERFPDAYEVEVYFKKCVAELDLILPEKRVALFEYAKDLASHISTGIVKPRVGLNRLNILWAATDYDEPLYNIWDQLAEDVYSVYANDSYLWNTELSKDNIESFICDVAKQFLQLCNCELPEDFFQLCVCDECGHVIKPQLKRIDLPWLPEKLFRLIYRKAPAFRWMCGSCASWQIKNMFDYAGRKQYLESQHKTL